MKTKQFILFALTALMLTSCGMGSSSFSTQKYTSFKKKKMYAAQDISVHHTNFNEIESGKSDNEVDRYHEDDPKTTRIKTALQKNEHIIIAKDTNYFELQDGTYDQFYQQLHGKLVPIERDSISSNALILHSKKELKEGVYFENVEELHYTTSPSNTTETVQTETNSSSSNNFERTTFKERRSWPEVTREEEKKSVNAKRTKQFFGASVGLFFGAVIAAFLALITWSGAFIVVAIVMLVLSQIFSIASFVFAQKYRIETRNKKKRRRLGMRILTALLFMSMYYLLVTLIGMGASLL